MQRCDVALLQLSFFFFLFFSPPLWFFLLVLFLFVIFPFSLLHLSKFICGVVKRCEAALLTNTPPDAMLLFFKYSFFFSSSSFFSVLFVYLFVFLFVCLFFVVCFLFEIFPFSRQNLFGELRRDVRLRF